jgi:hypothetical protein
MHLAKILDASSKCHQFTHPHLLGLPAKGLASFCAQTPQALRIIITPENFTQYSDNPLGFLQQVSLS